MKPFLAYVDFGAFYSTAIEKILAGSPLEMYAFVARPPEGGLAIPVSHPPVWFFYLSPWYALGRAIGLADFGSQSGTSFGQAWMLVATLPLDLLLCRAVLGIADAKGRIEEPARLLLYLCLLLSPLLWLSSVRFQHNEAAMVLLVLLAVGAGERGRHKTSGLFWGLALGVKTTAIVPALAYFGWGLGSGRRRSTASALAIAAVVFLVPLVPYLLLRREQISYALVGFERLRPVGGYVAWKLLPDPGAVSSHANFAILALSALLGLAMARRRGESFLESGGAFALVLGQTILLLLGKALYVWYGLALSTFLFLAWALERESKRSIPTVPLVASLLLWLVQGGGWVGEAVSARVRIRSAAWVALILAVAAISVRGLLGGRKRSGPGRGAIEEAAFLDGPGPGC